MSQTLFAVLALALAMLLTLTVSQTRLSESQAQSGQQATVYATDAGLEMLDRIRALDFDAATVGAAPDAPLADRASLTPQPFATGGSFTAAQDVDDVNGMQPYTIDIGGMALHTTASVRYVQEDALSTDSPTPSYAKEVTVYVWGDAVPDTLALSQVVSYP